MKPLLIGSGSPAKVEVSTPQMKTRKQQQNSLNISARPTVWLCATVVPQLRSEVLDAAPNLRVIGELEGDRFASRIDLEAAWERGIRTVDTTNGSSYPVSEWALGLILIALRNAGAQFRRIIGGETTSDRGALNIAGGLLTGKRVGLIGCGNMGRRLIKFLRPFEVDIWVHDPYLPREMAEAIGFLQTSLDNLLSQCDVIVCVAPLTPGTRRMIGERELNLIQSGAALVNVSRGPNY